MKYGIGKITKGWSLCDQFGNYLKDISRKKTNGNGLLDHNSDKSTYVIKNITSNEIFTGTRTDMKNKLNMGAGGMTAMIKHNKMHKNWVLNKDAK